MKVTDKREQLQLSRSFNLQRSNTQMGIGEKLSERSWQLQLSPRR